VFAQVCLVCRWFERRKTFIADTRVVSFRMLLRLALATIGSAT
jgi:hypothetical protein